MMPIRLLAIILTTIFLVVPLVIAGANGAASLSYSLSPSLLLVKDVLESIHLPSHGPNHDNMRSKKVFHQKAQQRRGRPNRYLTSIQNDNSAISLPRGGGSGSGGGDDGRIELSFDSSKRRQQQKQTGIRSRTSKRRIHELSPHRHQQHDIKSTTTKSTLTNIPPRSGTQTPSQQQLRNNNPITALLHRVFNISPNELPQFLTMSILMFLFIYIFTTVRDTKDTLVVSNCGAEAIPFLKLYGVMPVATLFLVVYSKMAGVFGKELLFVATLIPFFVFYVVFAFVLFPLRDHIHFGSGGDGWMGTAMGSLIRYWSFSLYFIISELWASAGVPLLFWQCANDVTTLEQAKKFYPLFAVIGNLAPIISGQVMSRIVSLQTSSDDVGFGQTLQKLAIIKTIICIGIITLYKTIYSMAGRHVSPMTTTEGGDQQATTTTTTVPKKKQTTTLRTSILECSKSPALRSMATMVICYNLCIELSEVVWKGLLRKMYPTKSEYMTFMAGFSQKVGVVALVLQLLAPRIIGRLGWKGASILTPVIMTALVIPFFVSAIILQRNGGAGDGEGIANSTSGKMVTLTAALAFGTWQIIASKVTKYSLFDPCKEIAYIPLDPELKVKGKAAVEVMGARLGRSVGSLSQQLLVLSVGGGSMMDCIPFVGFLYVSTVGVWLRAVCVLGRLFERVGDDGDDG